MDTPPNESPQLTAEDAAIIEVIRTHTHARRELERLLSDAPLSQIPYDSQCLREYSQVKDRLQALTDVLEVVESKVGYVCMVELRYLASAKDQELAAQANMLANGQRSQSHDQ